MPEITITTNFGHYSVSFETDEELTDALQRIQEHTREVEETTRNIRPRLRRSPKPGLESAYDFTAEGHVELFHFPPEGIRSVVLTLFAYHPDMVTASEVEAVTGIDDVYNKVLRQTNNKKYFRNKDGLFGLSQEGIRYFIETVLPTLPSPSISAPEGNDQ